MPNYYDDSFYNEQKDGAYISGLKVGKILNKFITPTSIIDIGCGVGAWLKGISESMHVEDLLGIDGDYVDAKQLHISEEQFLKHDLTKSLKCDRKFDLAVCMEVAEHLPLSNAVNFVTDIVRLSDIILFSAAIPGQMGTYHINEQYPEFWAKLFLQNEYVCVDLIRPAIWNDTSIEWWYRQNILLFVKKEMLSFFPVFKENAERLNIDFLTRIHPALYEDKLTKIKSLSTFFSFLNYKWYEFKKKKK